MSDAESTADYAAPRANRVRQVRRGFTAGVLATVIMSVAFLLSLAMGGALLPRPVPMAVGEALLGTTAPTIFVLAITVAIHLTYGGLWAAGLALVKQPVTETSGVLLGVWLWILEQLAIVPLLGWNVFGIEAAASIAATSLVFSGTSLLFHLIYGLTVGMLLSKEVL